MSALLSVDVRTIGRALSELVKAGLVEHRGSKKTGGYYAIGPSPSPTTPSTRPPTAGAGATIKRMK